MFRLRNLLLMAASGGFLLCLFFIFTQQSSAAALLSPTIELMKCKKLSNPVERTACYTLYQKKIVEAEATQTKQYSSGDKSGKVDFKNSRNDFLVNHCLRIYEPIKRAACFAKFRQDVESQQAQLLLQKKQAEAVQQAELDKNIQEFPLKIKICEDKKSHRERIVCYANFHREQIARQTKTTPLPTPTDSTQTTPGPIYSKTLELKKCQKLIDRNERNKCLKNFYYKDRDREEEERRQRIANFDLDAELRKCYALKNEADHDDCLDEVEKLERQVFESQDSDRQQWLDAQR